MRVAALASAAKAHMFFFLRFMLCMQSLGQTSWEHFQGLLGKARIREKRPKKALEEQGGTPLGLWKPSWASFHLSWLSLEPLEMLPASLS